MRTAAIAAVTLAVVGCSKAENKPADSQAAQPAAATPVAPPAALNLADVAGTWNVKATNEKGDSTLVTYTLKATADTSGWTITFPNRPPVPVHVTTTTGDSLVIHAGPYESAIRKGVQVTTDGVVRLQGGKLTGRSIAHYSVKTADSVRTVITEGTRAP